MTNPAERDTDSMRDFAHLWSESLSLVLAQITGAPFPLVFGDAPPEPWLQAENDVYLIVAASGKLHGELALRVPQAGAASLAKVFLGGTEPASVDEARSALEELFRQVTGYVVTSAKAMWPELALTVNLGQAPTWPAAALKWLYTASGEHRVAVELSISAAVNAALSAAQQQNSSPAPESSPQVQAPVTDAGTLDFFMDLELGVTLRFGGRDILLKDILDLGPGSVLELDREVQDPADLLLDGKLIARGEVVLVNGNYGLRVTQVLTGVQAQA